MEDLKFIPRFRAFIKEKKLVEVSKINFKEKYIEYFDKNNNTVIATFDEIELSQYSGCFDTKGKEIASGDIIKIVNNESTFEKNAGEIYEIYYTQGCFRMKPKYPSSIARGLLGYCLDENNICKILGNKFEKPELLEKIYK